MGTCTKTSQPSTFNTIKVKSRAGKLSASVAVTGGTDNENTTLHSNGRRAFFIGIVWLASTATVQGQFTPNRDTIKIDSSGFPAEIQKGYRPFHSKWNEFHSAMPPLPDITDQQTNELVEFLVTLSHSAYKTETAVPITIIPAGVHPPFPNAWPGSAVQVHYSLESARKRAAAIAERSLPC
jgi:hypothetical protein